MTGTQFPMPSVLSVYEYDANDQLQFEWLDADNNGTAEQITSRDDDHTRLTEESIRAGFHNASTSNLPPITGRQRHFYDLRGRMNVSVRESYDSLGMLSGRERSLIRYDRRGYRVGQTQQTGSLTVDLSQSTWTTTEDFDYLVSHSNYTEYAQTLRTSKYNAGGDLVKEIDYTFCHDGHGSVRVLYDLAETVGSIVEQIITYSALGNVIATHAGVGTFTGFGGSAPITSLQYSGEAWDAALNRGYNRARWYNPATAQWNRLDPYSGNTQEPQSLHKYAYVHGDPITGVDPTGEFS